MTEQVRTRTNGIELNVATAGAGPPVVLLHGFPHTWRVWSEIIGPLSGGHRVLAPDLRGFGDSEASGEGLDAGTLATDIEGLLGGESATVVALDAGVPVAFLLALRRPDLVRRLVLVEGTLGTLPGAEDFLAGGPPWWFGFHAVPGLAETVLAGHEAEYVGWFYDQGTRGRGVRPDVREAFGRAYARPGALGRTLGFYRALPRTGSQLAEAASRTRLTVPTTAIGAAPVGRALEQQLRPLCEDLTGLVVPDCGHIVPLDRPAALLEALSL
ncbi:alpha/beta hydrolase [Pseudonocardia ailaonensis]|uniref:alpha/beta fold hydrolase n=1 Tax=Pseudonocardia ailaonensis TaxID=367279 RepID=UPI0031D1C6C5